MRREVLPLLAVLVLAACGRPTDAEEASIAVGELLAALEAGDGTQACERLTSRGRAELALLVGSSPARTPDPCPELAERVPAGEPRRLRRLPVEQVLVHGARAAVRTREGSFGAEEHDGRWRVRTLEPLAAAVGGDAGPATVLTVVRPEMPDPALGPVEARTVRDADLEVLAVVHPSRARVHATGRAVREITAEGTRVRLRLRLRRGVQEVRLRATAAGRRPAQVVLRLHRR